MTIITATNGSITRSGTPVLSELNLSLEPGVVHGIVGRNAVGKTTFLQALAGQIPSTGITVCGANPFNNADIMSRIVLMGADVALLPSWSVRSIVQIAASRWTTFDETYADGLIKAFEIDDRTDYGRLSRGQKSAIQFIVAMSAGCDLTLLDEPYLGLDIEKRALMYHTIATTLEETDTTVVMATHEPHDGQQVIDTITLLSDATNAPTITTEELTRAILVASGPATAVNGLAIEAPILGAQEVSGLKKITFDMRSYTDEQISDAVDLARSRGVNLAPSPIDNTITALLGMQVTAGQKGGLR